MNLKSDKRQNIHLELGFFIPRSGEACRTGREEIESLSTAHETESLATTFDCSVSQNTIRYRQYRYGGTADIIAFGRPYVNPDLVEQLTTGATLDDISWKTL